MAFAKLNECLDNFIKQNKTLNEALGEIDSFPEALKAFAEEYEYRYTDDYSGRCMYGKTCVGVVGPKDMLGDFIEFLYENDLNQFVSIAKKPTWDNMGLNYIMYYPAVSTSGNIEEAIVTGEDIVEAAGQVENDRTTSSEKVLISFDNLLDYYNNPNGNLYTCFDGVNLEPLVDFSEEELLDELGFGAEIYFIPGTEKTIKNEAHMNNDVCNSLFENEQEFNVVIPKIIGQKKLPDDYIDWIEAHSGWENDYRQGKIDLFPDYQYDGKDKDFDNEHYWGDVTDTSDWQTFFYRIMFDTHTLQITDIIPMMVDAETHTETPIDEFLAPSGYNYDVRVTPEIANHIKKLAEEYINNNIAYNLWDDLNPNNEETPDYDYYDYVREYSGDELDAYANALDNARWNSYRDMYDV